MANLNGTNLAALVVPFTTEDNYATHDSKYGKGGWHEVANVTERNQIPSDRLTVGMACYVTSEEKIYIYQGNNTWKEFEGGVSDYTALTNKPQINSITLSGNKTASDLGLAIPSDIPTKTSELTNDGDGTNPFLTQHQSLEAYRTASEQDAIDATKIGDAPSDNKEYARKNGLWTEVVGGVKSVNNKTGAVVLDAEDVGALPDTTVIPTKTSQLTNDSGFLTQHQSLSAYRTASAQDTIDNAKADKSTTYTKTEVNDLLDDKADVDDIPAVINNVSSTSTTDALSANMGKDLNDRINNINVGRFLSFWNCVTGLPLSNPSGYPYQYATSDYFIVSNVGTTNYMPNGSSYVGEASTTVCTETVKANDIFRYDGTRWLLLSTPVPRGNVVDVKKNGTTVVDSQGIANVTVPTVVSALTNDSGYQTSSQVQSTVSGAISSHNSDGTAHSDIRGAIPTKTSDLTNDSNFITSSALSAYRTSANQDTIDNAKADKIVPSASGNLASLNASGNLQDSGKKASDFVLSSDISEYTASEIDELWEATDESI